MLLNVVLAGLMRVVTTGVHAGGMTLAMHLCRHNNKQNMSR